jgi:glycosyltransferase involved in cell wall biosynthesis
MRIAQIATVSTPVRRDHAGSVESIAWLLAREFTRVGHDVTTFGCAGSECAGTFVETLPGAYGENGSPDDWNACEWINVCKAIERSDEFDVVHSHAYLWGVTLSGLSRSPLLNTLHVLPYDDEATLWRLFPQARVSAISSFQWADHPEFAPCAVVPHGVDPALFEVSQQAEDYVVYLGRFIVNKGPVLAIEAARRAGVRIKLAGPRSDYFDSTIAPLVDGDAVEYVGPVSAAERSQLLCGARALVYPLVEPEPFGLVQVEAMMCGTPVAAIGVGAVPEVVEEGVTGAIVDATTPGEARVAMLARAIESASSLPRGPVAAVARERFSSTTMARRYVELYQQLIENG